MTLVIVSYTQGQVHAVQDLQVNYRAVQVHVLSMSSESRLTGSAGVAGRLHFFLFSNGILKGVLSGLDMGTRNTLLFHSTHY